MSTELCGDAVYDRRVKPYWLDERAEPLDAGRHDGPVDVAIVSERHELLLCAHAGRGRKAGSPVREARDRLRRERAERRLPLRGGAMRGTTSPERRSGLNVQPRSGA